MLTPLHQAHHHHVKQSVVIYIDEITHKGSGAFTMFKSLSWFACLLL
ncbi:hypothetical protein BTN49_1644 [Candidatus Enterovibrio escicola]|uniref:Uncharacterized protein n=1 Tax=Candidatus Enterovibrio escicola TaxID=1927127 RepID=A0A2A5T3G2_9GAMM|nr:hypothetical protein BTN49_1644 [Candidatus Enterovibrio escacola]